MTENLVFKEMQTEVSNENLVSNEFFLNDNKKTEIDVCLKKNYFKDSRYFS